MQQQQQHATVQQQQGEGVSTCRLSSLMFAKQIYICWEFFSSTPGQTELYGQLQTRSKTSSEMLPN